MAKSRFVVEQQLKLAKKALEAYTKKLAEQDIESSRLRYQPHWRHLDAEIRQLTRQLKSVERRESFNKDPKQ